MDSESRQILGRAQEKLVAAEQEAERWREWIRRFMELAQDGIGVGKNLPLHTSTLTTSQRRPAPEVEETVRVATDFIAKLGRPATLVELHDEMMRLGVPVGGKDPKATLDSRLRYSGEFQTARGKGWWIAGQAYPGQISSPGSVVTYSLGDAEAAEPPLEVSNSGTA